MPARRVCPNGCPDRLHIKRSYNTYSGSVSSVEYYCPGCTWQAYWTRWQGLSVVFDGAGRGVAPNDSYHPEEWE